MQDHTDGHSKPGQLAAHLAELEYQLRLSHAAPAIRKMAGPARGWSPVRLRLSAKLVGKVGGETGETGLQELAAVMPSLLTALDSRPGQVTHLESPLTELDNLLTEFITGLDAGDPLGQWLTDPGWDTVHARFRNAGTGLTVLSDLDSCLRRWVSHWGAQDLAPRMEGELRAGWESLRDLGDALFASGQASAPKVVPDPVAGARRALLLVDSSFRRDQLHQKLVEMGFSPEVMAGPEAAVTRLLKAPGPRVVLCDNLEPSHNLARVADQLDDFPVNRRPPLILIAGGTQAPDRENQRARSLGGVGAWTEPYVPDSLTALLSP